MLNRFQPPTAANGVFLLCGAHFIIMMPDTMQHQNGHVFSAIHSRPTADEVSAHEGTEGDLVS